MTTTLEQITRKIAKYEAFLRREWAGAFTEATRVGLVQLKAQKEALEKEPKES